MKTKNLKKVMIALDFNPTSKKIAEAGFALANTMGAELILLHVIGNPALYSTMNADMGVWQIYSSDTINNLEIFENLRTGSQKFLEKVKTHLDDKSIQIVLKEGDVAQMILETATEINADCIVLGSHSQKWLENIVIGSVAEEVLRKTTIPMYIIPTKKRV